MSTSANLTLTLSLVRNVALLLVATFIYSLFYSTIRHRSPIVQVLVKGSLFGLFAVLSMMMQVSSAPGVLADGRTIMLAIAGAVGGWPVAGIAAAVAVPFRLWLGGAGAQTGVGSIITCAALGSLLFWWRKGNVAAYTRRILLLLGISVALLWIGWTLFLPGSLPSMTLEANALPVIVLFPAGTFLMGTLLVREQRRIETDEALAAERNLLRILIDTIPDFVFVKDTHNRFIIANRATYEAANFSIFEQLAGKTDFDLFPHEIAQPFYEDEQKLIRSGQTLVSNEEASLDLKTGVPVWFSTTKVPLHDPQGHVTGILGISRNITERKAQEEALHRSEKRFRTLMESAPDALVIVNQQGRIELVNSQAERLFGYHREDLLGQAVERLIPEPFHDRHAAHREGYVADPRVRGMGIGLELYALCKDGSQMPVEVSLSPIETENGVLIASAVRDISERKRAEARLTAERALLRTLIDAIPDYIFVKDTTGRFTLSNIAHAHAAQVLDPDELIGKTAAEVFPTEMAGRFDADDQTLLQSGIPLISQERQSINQAGQAIWVLTTKVPLRNPEGEVIGLVGISRDITASKLAEQQARDLIQERERVRILADFVRNISHDFRTPLTIINTSVDLLRKTSDPERQTKRMNVIEQQVRRLTEFLERLVVMTRLDSLVTLNFQPISISQISDHVASLIQPLVRDKGVVLQVDTAPNLPLIQADSVELTQAVREILKNAIWFTPSGGTVSVTTGMLDGQGVIQVRDTGTGIASDDLPRIFERLYRVDKARSIETGGFGLGLSIAKRILDLHGGTIEVESKVGTGSVFRLLLPLKV